MCSRRRSSSLDMSLSVVLSLWLVFISLLNSLAFSSTASHCISGLSPDEPFKRASYLIIPVKTEIVSPMWRSVSQSQVLFSHVNLPVVSPLLSPASILCILWRPDLKIYGQLPCLSSLWVKRTLPTGKICSILSWHKRSISQAVPLPLLVKPVKEYVQYCENIPATKNPMVELQIHRRILLLYTESTQARRCDWFFKPPLVIKDYSLCCCLPCQLQQLRGALSIFLDIYAGFWPEKEVFIFSVIAFTTTSSSSPLIHSKLALVNLLNLTTMEKFIQTSSCSGRERSFSTSSFSQERIIPSKFLFVRGDFTPVTKTGKTYQFPSRLLSYVNVHLEPVDATTLVQMRVEVLDGVATSLDIVTNRLLFEDLEMWFELLLDWITSGNFCISHNVLSNFSKFVSLSLFTLELYVGVFAHRGMYDVANSLVIV
ncbi:unnamed protein product [Brassica oleracea]